MYVRLKVLFVRSGNDGIDPISSNQGASLERDGITVIYFNVIGKGVLGYLKNLKELRKLISRESPDLIHAHYSLSGYLSFLASKRKPVVCSLMGSDVLDVRGFKKFILFVFGKYLWNKTIVKTKAMADLVPGKFNIEIIPNGVNMDIFHPVAQIKAQELLGWDKGKLHILFASSPSRPEKNFELARQSLNIFSQTGMDFISHFLENVEPQDVYLYFNAAHLTLLTSKHEGSPNIIKEAMACNRPIVSTDVGDVRLVFGNTDGCYITLFDHFDCANRIREAIEFSLEKGETKGRERIIELGLDDNIIANQVIEVYNEVLCNSKNILNKHLEKKTTHKKS